MAQENQPSQTPEGLDQLRKEIIKVINRHCKEADLTYCGVFGVLELVKFDMMKELDNIQKSNED